ncbi:MAG: hypothetical protein KC503_46485 [Myxococcales bacterium]|nr:hypothetical protein [Myxococcales bacterium]
MSARSEHIAFDLGPYDGLGPRSRRETVDANDPAMFSERVEMLERTGRRLGRLLGELDDIDADIERLDRILFMPELDEELRHRLLGEIDIAVSTYNLLRDAAAGMYRQLVLQREDCGFREHEVLRRLYPVPDVHQLGEPDDFAQLVPTTE